jgi:hypothetical protein
MKRLRIILIALTGLTSGCVNALHQGSSATDVKLSVQTKPSVGIEISGIDVYATNETTKFTINITNLLSKPIRFSGFDLETQILRTHYFDSEGHEWEIMRSPMISDPPPPKQDFEKTILPGASMRVTCEVRLIKPSSSRHESKPGVWL